MIGFFSSPMERLAFRISVVPFINVLQSVDVEKLILQEYTDRILMERLQCLSLVLEI